jgi:hypothetical protein
MRSSLEITKPAWRRRFRVRGAPVAMLALSVAATWGSVATWGTAAGAATPAAHAVTQARAASTTTRRPAVPPVHGYDEHWLFNANDGEPTVSVGVARNGTFAFNYLPSYCGTGMFRFHGAFEPVRSSLLGDSGYAVSMSVSGSCLGKGQSVGNTFLWSKAEGISILDKWPDSRAVQGEMIQTAIVVGGRGNLEIDWWMSAN